MAKQIMCIGDSNTWGYDPRGFGGGRYPAAMRWTARLDSQPGWVIHNLGENGREIPHSAFALRLLEQQLDALAPFDGICLMLGRTTCSAARPRPRRPRAWRICLTGCVHTARRCC